MIEPLRTDPRCVLKLSNGKEAQTRVNSWDREAGALSSSDSATSRSPSRALHALRGGGRRLALDGPPDRLHVRVPHAGRPGEAERRRVPRRGPRQNDVM
jgi:hypothetical protein